MVLTNLNITVTSMKQSLKDTAVKLPSIVWVFVIPLALVAFVAAIITIFTLLATLEGFASLIMIISALIFLRATKDVKPIKDKVSNIITALGICFFALMGVAIDQPGNILYNKPLEIFFCPTGSTLTREVKVSNPLPGRTDYIQGFFCVDSNKEVVDTITVPEIIIIRFSEYVLLGYGLMYLFVLIRILTRQRANLTNNQSML